jgi:hypothetical protein
MSKVIIILIIVVGLAVLLWWTHTHTYTKEPFESAANKLTDLKKDLRNLLTQTVDYDIKSFYDKSLGCLKEHEITQCVRNALKENKIPFDTFTMDGEKMSDPILQMYNNDRRIYNILGRCDFLTLIGRIVSVAAWVSQGKRNKESSEKFLKCLLHINFSDIRIWNTMSNPHGMVLKCVNS